MAVTMPSRVVILASSVQPDVYFNIIAFNARQNVREFVVAVIDPPTLPSGSSSDAVQKRLQDLVNRLSESKYLKVTTEATTMIPLVNPEPMATFLAEVNWYSLQITYRSVAESDLKEFLDEEQQAGAAFDVTACRNTALAGAVAWLVSRGGAPLHSLEVKRPFRHDASDLLPYLDQSDYAYPELSASKLIRAATRRVNRGTLRKKTFWILSVVGAILVGALSYFAPSELSTPILTAAAAFATVMSAVAILVRNPA
ncbi:hypothetical protein [Plantibacter sp. M259]|uniref:hypothetical protein n=1 Tax=Plantibacter sp. M259 TaxID=2583822 RepID=UPI001110B41A|nr:hypothetical protein [Plantibacter sp. M259]